MTYYYPYSATYLHERMKYASRFIIVFGASCILWALIAWAGWSFLSLFN